MGDLIIGEKVILLSEEVISYYHLIIYNILTAIIPRD